MEPLTVTEVILVAGIMEHSPQRTRDNSNKEEVECRKSFPALRRRTMTKITEKENGTKKVLIQSAEIVIFNVSTKKNNIFVAYVLLFKNVV